MKKIIFITIVLFLLFSTLNLSSPSQAESKGLELDYPKIQEIKPTISMPLGEYVKYIFNFAIWVAGIVAFLLLVIGGIKYLTSIGNSSARTEAKKQINSSFLGLLILFLSVLILNEINPQLLSFSTESLREISENSNFAFANGEKSLEIDYPEVGGYKPESISDPIDKYVRYLFNFALWTVGIVGFLMFLIAGTEYLISPGSPGLQSDAKDRMTQATIGILLLLSSILILSQINFNAALISPTEVDPTRTKPPPGVWICKEKIEGLPEYANNYENTEPKEINRILKEIEEKCFSVNSRVNLPDEFKDQGKYVYLIEGDRQKYGAVLHGGKNFTLNCQVVSESNKEIRVEGGLISGLGPASITPFIITDEAIGEGVTLYSHRDYNAHSTQPLGGTQKEEYEQKGPFKEDTWVEMDPCYSIRIDDKKNWVAILRAPSIPGAGPQAPVSLRACDVFDESDNNLQNVYVSHFCIDMETWARNPCVGKVEIFKGYILE
jgi:hypothetical protein